MLNESPAAVRSMAQRHASHALRPTIDVVEHAEVTSLTPTEMKLSITAIDLMRTGRGAGAAAAGSLRSDRIMGDDVNDGYFLLHSHSTTTRKESRRGLLLATRRPLGAALTKRRGPPGRGRGLTTHE